MAHRPIYAWGSLFLWREGIVDEEADELAPPQEHFGLDQDTRLLVPSSRGAKLTLPIRCLGAPHPDHLEAQKGWRATWATMRAALRARMNRSDPVVWILDGEAKKVVSGYSAPTITTSTPHGLTVGDVALVRRSGTATYTLGAVLTTPTDSTFTMAATYGAHAIATSDEVHLVEAYWSPMLYVSAAPAPFAGQGDHYAKEVIYTFVGSGSAVYRRTAASAVTA